MAVVDSDGVDEVWCLGDITGYGARPRDCLTLTRERSALMLAGNHDLVVSGKLDVNSFSADAAIAARWAHEQLSEAERTELAALPPLGQREGISLYHGSIRDPVWEYVLTAETARACLELQTTPLTLVGHSHIALSLELGEDGRLDGGKATTDAVVPLRGRQLLNPGSVGQPRDRDPRAAWLLLDLEAQTATFRRTTYDIERTQLEIRDAGLPGRLADRLSYGA